MYVWCTSFSIYGPHYSNFSPHFKLHICISAAITVSFQDVPDFVRESDGAVTLCVSVDLAPERRTVNVTLETLGDTAESKCGGAFVHRYYR